MTCEMHCTEKSGCCPIPTELYSTKNINFQSCLCPDEASITNHLALSLFLYFLFLLFFSIPENVLKVTPASDHFHWNISGLINLFLLFCD